MSDRKWERWGAELRHHRTAAGIAQSVLAKTVHLAGSTLSAIERGTRRPRREHALAADEALATGGALAQLWDELHDERELPREWRDYEKLERRAATIREYHSTLVPGLLQTREYACALFRNTGAWEESQVEGLAKARAARLEHLAPTSLSFVVNEEAVRKGHGTWELLRAQLHHLLRLIGERRIRFQVVPRTTLHHPCPEGAFRIMTLKDNRLVGHEQYLSGINVLSGPRVNELVELFGNVQGEALSPRASAELLEAIRKEL